MKRKKFFCRSAFVPREGASNGVYQPNSPMAQPPRGPCGKFGGTIRGEGRECGGLYTGVLSISVARLVSSKSL
jgi:hypothetical protein